MSALNQWPLKSSNAPFYLLVEEEERNKARVILPALYEQEGNPHWEPLFLGTPWQAHERRSPLLIQTRADSPFVHWLRKHSLESGELRGLIIESTATLDQVAEWARAALRVTFDGQRKGLLRFYDPYVWHRLEPANISDGNPISRVHYWLKWPAESEGRWLSSDCPMPVYLPNSSLSSDQQQALAQLPDQLYTNEACQPTGKEAEHV